MSELQSNLVLAEKSKTLTAKMMEQQMNHDLELRDSKVEKDDLNQGMIQSAIEEEIEPLPSVLDPYGSIDNIKCITEWESRKKFYKPENLKYLDEIQGYYDKYISALNLPDWKIQVDDTKVGLKIWQRNQGGLKAMKAQAIIERCPEDVFRIIGNLSFRKEYDDTYDDGYALEQIAHQTFIQYQKTKKVAVVSARDFVYILSINKRPDGVIYAMVNSVERDDLKPIQQGIVRGKLDLGGWRLEPVAGNPKQTLCQFQALMDLKGSIPGFVLSQVNKDLGYQIIKLRKVVDKHYAGK